MSEVFARAVATMLSPKGRRARLAVFCYHHVLQDKDPLRPNEPDQEEFENDIRLLNRVFTVLPLSEAITRLTDGTLPARSACVTFDDGYENNYLLAVPILKRTNVPATIFVAGDAIDRGVMWNDLIIETIAKRGSRCVFDALPLPNSSRPRFAIGEYVKRGNRKDGGNGIVTRGSSRAPCRILLSPGPRQKGSTETR